MIARLCCTCSSEFSDDKLPLPACPFLGATPKLETATPVQKHRLVQVSVTYGLVMEISAFDVVEDGNGAVLFARRAATQKPIACNTIDLER